MKALITMVLLLTAFSSHSTSIIREQNILCSNDQGAILNIRGHVDYDVFSIGMPIGRYDTYEVQSVKTETFENINQTVITGKTDANTCVERTSVTGEADIICLAIYIPRSNFKLVMTGDTAVLYTKSEDNYSGSKTRTTVLKCSNNERVAPAL